MKTADEVSRLNKFSILYLKEDRDHAADLIRYVGARKDLSPTSIQSRISITRLWLEANDIPVSPGKTG